MHLLLCAKPSLLIRYNRPITLLLLTIFKRCRNQSIIEQFEDGINPWKSSIVNSQSISARAFWTLSKRATRSAKSGHRQKAPNTSTYGHVRAFWWWCRNQWLVHVMKIVYYISQLKQRKQAGTIGVWLGTSVLCLFQKTRMAENMVDLNSSTWTFQSRIQICNLPVTSPTFFQMSYSPKEIDKLRYTLSGFTCNLFFIFFLFSHLHYYKFFV